MENKFQTSFIPKKPLVADASVHPSHSVNLVTAVSLIIFLMSVGAAVLTFGWHKVLEHTQQSYRESIEKSRQRFSGDINFLQRFNAKVNMARDLLIHHVSVADVFERLSSSTVDKVRFKSFDFSVPSSVNDRLQLSMKGEAATLPSVAFQSDVFGLGSDFKDPVITDLALNEKGYVTFSFTAGVDPQSVSYVRRIESASSSPLLRSLPSTNSLNAVGVPASTPPPIGPGGQVLKP